MSLYYQCTLVQGTAHTIGYIDEHGAVQGKQVTLKDEGFEGWWTVESVGDKGIPKEKLAEYQQMNRNAFPSIEESTHV